MIESEDDVRRSMRLAALIIALIWACFGTFIAWVCMSLVYPDVPPVLAFVGGCVCYVIVSGALVLILHAMVSREDGT
jgi:zinc transporter ZupT